LADDFIELQRAGFEPLFDPTGVRQMIRQEIWKTRFENRFGQSIPFPNRRGIALTIDEESSFAYFTALAAYRSGFRVAAIPSWRLMERVIGEAEEQSFAMTFEDVYLNFADRPDLQPWVDMDKSQVRQGRVKAIARDVPRRFSCLEYRDALFPTLAKTKHRVMVTSGADNDETAHRVSKCNEEYFAKWEKQGDGARVYKPIAGLFRLLREANWWESNQPKKPDGFAWPPDWEKAKPTETPEDAGHSAPGRIILVAERLVDRSRRLLKDCQSVPDAVHAAVLAMEAKELLAEQTPTMALEALTLQHEAEVTAESLFAGVQSNIEMSERFDEIQAEAVVIAKWFRESSREKAALNAQLVIVERLAQRFGAMRQVDEELACLALARKLQADFTSKGKIVRRVERLFARLGEFAQEPSALVKKTRSWIKKYCAPVGLAKRVKSCFAFFRDCAREPSVSLRKARCWATQQCAETFMFAKWLMLRYIAFCLFRLRNLVLMVVVWMLFFGVLHACTTSASQWGHGFLQACVAFITVNPAGDMDNARRAVLILWGFQGAVAFFHWGLLMSHAYLYISRR
jgi:hypothetical protein